MKTRWHMSVLIPARNEEQLLPRCLKSVLTARERLPHCTSCEVTVAVDCSTDRTLEIARQMIVSQKFGQVVKCHAGRVGEARALAARAALQQRTVPHSHWWLANTDADCEVPPDWLTRQLELARSGTEAVAGTIDVDSFQDHSDSVAERFRSTYLVHSDGTHPHVHGANFGVRADAYLRAGGWRDLETAEDHDLWERLSSVGCNRLSTDRLTLRTSGRKIGRAPHGFAAALAAHNERAA